MHDEKHVVCIAAEIEGADGSSGSHEQQDK
jgi:hypothetical protein